MFLFYYGCSSSPKSTANQPSVPVAPISYKPQTDYVVSYGPNSIYRESLNPKDKKKMEGDFSDIARMCLYDDMKGANQITGELYNQFQNHPGYWNAIGICFYQRDEYFRSEQFFRIALEVNKNYFPALNNLAILAIKDNNYVKAKELLLEGHKLSSKSQLINFNLAQLYLAFGHYENSLKHLNLLRDEEFINGDAAIYIGIANLGLGRFPIAKQKLKSIYEKNKKDESSKVLYALTLALSNEKDEARKVIGKSTFGRESLLYNDYDKLMEILND